MAVLIPEQIGRAQVPPGERKFHAFLKTLFESRPDVIAWHRVRVCLPPQNEPERRYRTLLFVGCTRARERLTLLGLTGIRP